MEIIETLQRSRPEIVHVFDELVRVLPEGVYLTYLKQIGHALRAARRRAVEHARLLVHAQHRRFGVADRPVAADRRDHAPATRPAARQFTLFANQRSQAPAEDAGEAAGKPEEGGRQMNKLKALFDQLRNLDPNDPGRWPFGVRIGTVVLLFVRRRVGGYYFFVWKTQRPVLLEARAKEGRAAGVRSSTKARKAANLEAYQDQLAEMEKSFGAMLRQLPNKTEVPNLLVDISQTGLARRPRGEAVPAAGREHARTSTPSCRSGSA